jgi:hypothetical protein
MLSAQLRRPAHLECPHTGVPAYSEQVSKGRADDNRRRRGAIRAQGTGRRPTVTGPVTPLPGYHVITASHQLDLTRFRQVVAEARAVAGDPLQLRSRIHEVGCPGRPAWDRERFVRPG